MINSCINHPAKEPLIIIRAWQVNACDGDHCAAALLSFFEYWHNVRLAQAPKSARQNAISEMHGDLGTQDTSLLQFHSEAELEVGLLGLYKKDKIRKTIALLAEKGFISVHSNPNPRYSFDRTRYFLFQEETVNEYLFSINDFPVIENRKKKAPPSFESENGIKPRYTDRHQTQQNPINDFPVIDERKTHHCDGKTNDCDGKTGFAHMYLEITSGDYEGEKDQEIAFRDRDRDRTQPKTLNPESYIQIETGPSESGSGKTAKGKSESASKKARGRSSPETDPEEFESWWKSYYAFCLKVDASAGARAQAVEAWDCLMADGTTSEDVIEGTKAFIEFGTKTLAEGRKVIGTPHGVRFLRNLKWQEAIDRKKAAAEIDTSTPGANIQGAQQNAALNEAQIEKNRRAYIEARQAHSRARMEKWLDRGFITEFFYEGEGLRARLSDGKILNEYDFPSTDHRWFRDEKLKAALGPNYDDDPFWDLEELPVNPHAGYIPWCVKGWQPDQVFPAMA